MIVCIWSILELVEFKTIITCNKITFHFFLSNYYLMYSFKKIIKLLKLLIITYL